MFARYEYTLSKDDYTLGLAALAKSLTAQAPHRGRRILGEIVILALVLVIAAVVVPGSLDAILLTMVLTLVAGSINQARFARRWRGLTFDPDRSDIAVTVDERGVVTEQSDIERRYSWSALRRIHELPECIVLELADWHAVPLPDQLWAGPEERATFVSGVRASAKQLLADLPTREQMTGTMLLLLLGAGALALQLMIMTDTAIRHAGLGDCSCNYRHSFQGQLVEIAPWVVYIVAFATAWLGLRRLARRWRRLAGSIAILFIVLFVASQAVPSLMQIHRFFSSPAP